eukprot:scaffold175398_cov33-Prasinocladus_malaysianus.AAC.1
MQAACNGPMGKIARAGGRVYMSLCRISPERPGLNLSIFPNLWRSHYYLSAAFAIDFILKLIKHCKEMARHGLSSILSRQFRQIEYLTVQLLYTCTTLVNSLQNVKLMAVDSALDLVRVG